MRNMGILPIISFFAVNMLHSQIFKPNHETNYN